MERAGLPNVVGWTMTTDERIIIHDGGLPKVKAVAGSIAFGIGALISLTPIFSQDLAGLLLSVPLVLFFGFPFGAVGAVLLFRRTGMWIDLKAQELVSWSKFLWHGKKVTSTPLSEFVDILVAEKSVRKNKTTKTYRSVYLRSEEPLPGIQEAVLKPAEATQKTVELYRCDTLEEAREIANSLSSSLSLPVSEDKDSPQA